jgi:glyoxylase-like metal-dependent hydrolase (beta-lactamase superfamily II)
MKFSSKLIMPGVWDIMDSPDGTKPWVNMYLIEGSEKAMLIDAGLSQDNLTEYVGKLTDKPVELIITHGHGDHAACAAQFEKVYMSHKDISILIQDKQQCDFYKSKIINLHGGEVFDLGGVKLEVIAFPGHTLGSIVVLDRERQLLFASDSMGSGELWMQLPHSTPMEAYAEEIKNFEKHIDGMKELKVRLGHDCLMQRKPDLQYIIDTRVAAEKIVSGELVGEPIEGNNPAYFGALSAKYGQINIIHKAKKIFKKKR